MKVYVAARFEQAAEVKKIYDKLKRASFVISCDWTIHRNVEEAGLDGLGKQAYAVDDINGVQTCDALLLLHTVSGGQGKFVELGAALALNKKCIVIKKAPAKDCIFFYLPDITVVEGVEEALLALEKWRSQN